MVFRDKYTTQSKLSIDSSDKEKKKILLSEEAYALLEALEDIRFQLSKVGAR